MAAETGSPASRVLGRLRPAALLPTLVGLAAAVAATGTWATWHRPVLEHDDWDILLPDGPVFVLEHARRTLYEGRWLNYWWWELGARHLSPLAATVGFGVGWLVVTATLTRVLARTWWAVPIAVALYASPMTGQIAYWPATTLVPMAVLAVSSVALALTRRRRRLHLAVLVATTLVQMLGYPAFALLVVPLLVALHARASWRRLLALAVAFGGAYVAGVIAVFALNAARFGVFGLRLQSWRHPTPLSGPGALLDHLRVVRHDEATLVEAIALPLLAIAVCLVLLLLRGRDERRRLAVLALGLLLAFGLSSASTVLHGIDVPFRSAGWVWPFGMIVLAWTLDGGTRGARAVAALAVVAVALWSAAYWAELTRGHQDYEAAIDRLQDRVVALHGRGHEPVVLLPRDSGATGVADLQAAWQLGNALAEEDGIRVRGRCASCARDIAYARTHAPDGGVLLHRGRILVRFPASVVRQALDAQPLPGWLTPFG